MQHRDNNFDGLRLIAALLVLLSHSFHLLGLFLEEPFYRLSGYFSGGLLGVSIFFAMSGYLVTGSWQRSRSMRQFLWHRLLRIVPGLAVVVALCAFVLGPLVTRLPLGEYFAHPATWAYLKNVLLLIHFPLPGVFETLPHPGSVNGSLWTLPIEAAMYLLLLLAGATGLLNRWTAPLLALGMFLHAKGLALLGLEQALSPSVLLPLRTATELGAYFFLGSTLYLFKDAVPWNKWVAVLLLLLWVVVSLTPFGPLGMLLAVPYLAIYAGTGSTPYLRRCGRFGDLSYGLYIYAFPLQQLVVQSLGSQQPWWMLFFCSLALTLPAAYLSWHWVEKRALRLKDRPFALPPRVAALAAGDGRRLAGATLAMIIAVGAGLRSYGLGNESLWPDEIYSVMLSSGFDIAAILRGVIADVHPPGYQLLLAVFIACFGDSEVAVRSLSVVAGALAVPVLYLLGARVYGRAEGLLAAALLAVSINAVFYSQEARSFALLLLGSVATGLAFHQAFLAENSRRARWCVAYVMISLVALYIHYYALLVLAVQLLIGGFAAYRCRELRRLWLASCVGIAMGFAPWLPSFLSHLQIKQSWIPQPGFASLLELFWFVFNDSRALALATAVATAAATAIALAAGVAGRVRPVRAGTLALVWLLCWALLPPLLAYGKSLVSTPIFTVRNLIICLPPAYLLIARAFTCVIDRLSAPQRRLQVACVIAIAGLVLGAQRFSTHRFYDTPKRMQYREAARDALLGGAGNGDAAIIATDDWFDFYLAKFGHGRRSDYRLASPAEFARVEHELSGRFWLLQGFNHVGDDTPLVRAIEAGYRPVYKRGFFVTQVMLFERSDAPPPSAAQR